MTATVSETPLVRGFSLHGIFFLPMKFEKIPKKTKCITHHPPTDAGQALGDLCARWHDDPPSTEVSAATSTLGAAVASATVANSTAIDNRPAHVGGLVGLAAAAALLL
jgi:hypothetical protein